MEKVEEMLREVRSRVRSGKWVEKEVLDGKGDKTEGCLASPVLFNILMANLEKEMSKVGRDKVRREEDIFAAVRR